MMNQFHDLGLSEPLVRAIDAMGFEQPTPIQKMAIPRLVDGRTDLIALAQTGTGKTAAFGLPLLDLIDPAMLQPQGLILAPTRELALQITAELQRFAVHLRQLRIVTVYGGADIRQQVRALRGGAQVIVATPGRFKDLMTRGHVATDAIHHVVLDEADEMLSMGFLPDIDFILEALPEERHIWLFSATISPEVQRLAGRYLRAPLEIAAGDRNTGNANIEHQYILLDKSEKYDVLRRLLDYHVGFYGLLFCRTRQEARELADQLTADGYDADAIHGELSQAQRERTMARFRQRQVRVLVATDVAARGIDVDDLSHVIHYRIPEDPAFYTHRSGRTGRAGKKGTSIALLTRRDLSFVPQIEKRSKVKLNRVEAPRAADIYRSQLAGSLETLRQTPVRDDIRRLLPELCRELEDLSKEELIARIASQALKQVGDYLPDERTAPARDRSAATRRRQRLFINVGRVDGYDKGGFLRLVCQHAGIPGEAVGQIDLQPTHAYFEVAESLAPVVMEKFQGSYMEDRPLRVNPANPGDTGRPKGKTTKKEKKKYRPA